MPSVEIFSCKFNCSFNSPIFNRLFNILEINKAFKLDFHIFVIYQVIASHLQTFRAVLTTNEKQQGYQSTISDIDRTRRNCQETVETAKPSNNSPRESDFESFNYEQAIAEILLELRENFKTSEVQNIKVSFCAWKSPFSAQISPKVYPFLNYVFLKANDKV